MHSNRKKWRGTKELLDESKKGEWINWLKTQPSKKRGHGIQPYHFMANRWGNRGSSDRFYLLGSKSTVDCSHEVKRHLLHGRKDMTNLNSVLKSRDIRLQTKICIVKAMVFPVVMYRCESWTINKSEYQRIDAFKQWYWRRPLRVSWTARKSYTQS